MSFVAAGSPAALGEVGDVRERRVEVVLAEVVRPERATEQGEVAVEVVVLLEDLALAPLRRLVVAATTGPPWMKILMWSGSRPASAVRRLMSA